MEQADVLIVGGGSAGWMAAALCSSQKPHWRITLVESERLGTIGVGEGSTPHFGRLMASLGLSEAEWMPACDASYKSGIDFVNWGGDGQRYFHPFLTPMDVRSAEVFFHAANARRRGRGSWTAPDGFFLASTLARHGLTPKPHTPLPAALEYGYHFDALKLAALLRGYAEKRGAVRIAAEVVDVSLGDNGEVTALRLNDGRQLSARHYIDASGFAARLIGEALKVPFESFDDKLLCDSAVTVATPPRPDKSHTRAEALSCGWMWQIPLPSRTGNGYVYSRRHCSSAEAANELTTRLGLAPDTPVRHLSMQVGMRSRCWQGNVLALGLAQGFVEPLEATSLMVTQFTLEQFLQRVDRPEDDLQAGFNRQWRTLMHGIVDYIQAHYLCARRRDSQFWREASATAASALLQQLLDTWRSGGDIDALMHANDNQLAYFRPSWYALLAGLDDRDTGLNMAFQGPEEAMLRAAADSRWQLLQRHFLTP
ncbi:FAD-dependent oxidoreductase [Shewanella sp. JM162201]|uniref:FAD-dependent oxidoreductase n=1 Tax=Shewanella jiangmenensis TaxID=2837387 RepID=A0ABS5V8H2_9GAMM|nr:tryptophan halogenase family protein [Shewanella jiangmenensis]MBT1446240.1 FAD-dependent oxidoreductase [Shewanella jiangmenensis]